jgi:hypothetical protein
MELVTLKFLGFPARPDDSYINKCCLPGFLKLGFTTLKKKRVLCDIILGCSVKYDGFSSLFTSSDRVSGSDWKGCWNRRAIASRETAPSPVIDSYNIVVINYVTCLLVRNSLCALYKLRLVPEKRHVKCVTLLL